MIETLLETPLASAAGLAAAALLVACPLMTRRETILLAQLGVGVMFALHFTLLGITAEAAVNVLGALQALAALFAGRHPALNRAGHALIPLMAAAGLWFWTGPVSGLAVIAMALIALARMQENEERLRLLLAGCLAWTAHDAIAGAWIALGSDLLTGFLGLAMLMQTRSRAPILAPAA